MIEKKINIESERYDGIDGLRTYSAIGIVLMHVKLNGGYKINGFISEKLIGTMGELVFLFMIISAFSMCCGYYHKILNNQISVNQFYSKRYSKIWPYFTFLCVIDVIISPSINALYELFANLTLCFGLLPNANIKVIGVGWFLGVVFVFYIIFPFFCYLISNKRRAWFSFIIALIFNVICQTYFFDELHVIEKFSMRTNFIYCAVFFMAGGLIYLYRKKLSEFSTKFRWISLLLCMLCGAILLQVKKSIFIMLLLFSLILIYSIGHHKSKILENKFTKIISNISMEIYLSHMVVFRIIEKLHMLHICKNNLLSYIIASTIILIGTVIFVWIVKWMFESINKIKNISY